ncbi:MAG: hypothetical protein CMIDDMOC_00284 [Sodalis sp. Fle]|nr:MAG: hypothetical protein CMIDDMOC_00284 [Sodalis sp. Fle]
MKNEVYQSCNARCQAKMHLTFNGWFYFIYLVYILRYLIIIISIFNILSKIYNLLNNSPWSASILLIV